MSIRRYIKKFIGPHFCVNFSSQFDGLVPHRIHRMFNSVSIIISAIIKLKIHKSIIPHALHKTLDSVTDEHEAVEEVASHFDLSRHNSFYVVQRKPLFQNVWLAGERVMFFRDSKGYSLFINS